MNLKCIYSFWYYSGMWLPAGVMDELELQFKLIQAVNTVKMLLMMSENIARNM